MFLLGTTTMFSQSTTVRGITLSYNKVKKTMTLNIPKAITYTNDEDADIKVEIHKELAMTMTINEETYSMTEPYFKHVGHEDDMGWIFITHKLSTCKEVKPNHIYVFYDIEVGEEYILSVSDLCDNKYMTKIETGSLVID